MLQRLWIYQRERFPLLSYIPLVLAFSAAILSSSARLRGAEFDQPQMLAAAAFSGLISFALLRIADEFKDYAEDLRYRPERPLPRGLVSRHELALLALLGLAMQLALALLLAPLLLGPLLALWLYLALMRIEFAVPDWLKAHPLIYLGSHMLVLPLIAGYVSAWDWLRSGAHPPAELAWLLGLSFANGLLLEFGRKLRAPHAERVGVETYSALWGVPTGAAAWFAAVCLSALCSLGLLAALGFAAAWSALLLPLAGLPLALRYALIPSSAHARQLEQGSALIILLLYTGLAVIGLLR